MKKILLFAYVSFIFNISFSQISLEDRVNIFDADSLGLNYIYDDFDNDNDLDIIKYGGSDSRNVLLQKNENGDFNYNPPILTNTDKNPIISLDLNNDNFPDLLTYHSFNTIGVLYNLQNDTFSDEVIVQSFNGSYSISPLRFDYNSDGFMDLIAIDNNNDAYVLLNNQIGGLEPAKYLLPIDTFDHIYKIRDFNNDGNFDIYVRDGDRLRVYLYDVDNDENDETDDFIQPNILQVDSSLRSYGIMDLDGNGYNDVLYWKNGSIWAKYFDLNIVTEQFEVLSDIMVVDNIPRYFNYANTRSIHIANEEDGIYPVYVTLQVAENQYDIFRFDIQNNIFSSTQVVLSDFQVNTFGVGQFQFLDLNSDDNLDFSFATNFNENKMIFINNNINELSDKTICIQQLVRPNNFSVIDMNGDGIKDIGIGTQNGLGYFEKKPNNELSDLRNLIGVMSNPNASTYTHNNIIDINNDGLGDVVDYTGLDNEAKIFKNLGNDNFEFVQSVSLTSTFYNGHLNFADIDNDGFKDLIVFNNDEYSGSDFYWAKNNNGTSFNSLEQINVNNVDNLNPTSIVYDHFNSDDQIDILVLRYFYEGGQWNTEVNLLLNNNGEFSGNIVASFNGNYGRSHMKICDFDQDDDLDFFVYSTRLDQPLLFFKNDGLNNFVSTTVDIIDIEDIEFYDGDGDGNYEIYAWNYDPYVNNVFYYATTDYLNFTKIPIDSYSASYDNLDDYTKGDLLMYDYDNDGKDDLFIDNFSAFQALISVYKNTSETLSIDEVGSINLNEIHLYPNPFVNSISWDKRESETYKLQLYSQDGKLIFQKLVSDSSIDFSSYKSGIYFLSMTEVNSDNKRTFKIIKK